MSWDLRRTFIVVAAALGFPGPWFMAGNGDFGTGVLWALGSSGAAGLIASFRLYPLRWQQTTGEKVATDARARRLIGDGVLVAGGHVVLGLGAAAVFWFTVNSADAAVWFVSLFAGVIAAVGFSLGILAGLLVFVPVSTAVKLRRTRFGAMALSMALLLLTLVALGIVTILAIDVDGLTQLAFWKTLPVLLFGVESPDAIIRSVPLLWVARLVLAVLFVQIVFIRRLTRRTGRTGVAE